MQYVRMVGPNPDSRSFGLGRPVLCLGWPTRIID